MVANPLDIDASNDLSPISQHIPWDIIDAIVKEVENAVTLINLCLVSFSVLQAAGPNLYSTVDLEGPSTRLDLFFGAPTLIPSTSRLRPHLGPSLLLQLRITLSDSFFDASFPKPIIPFARVLALSSPIPLASLTFASPRSARIIHAALGPYLPYLNPRRLVFTKGPLPEIFFHLDLHYNLLYRTHGELDFVFGTFNRVEEVVFEGVGISAPPFAGQRGLVLLPFLGSFNMGRIPGVVFDMRRDAREGFDDWVGEEGEVGECWEGWVKWLEESGVRETEGIQEGGVKIIVSEEEDEEILKGAVERLVKEKGRGRYEIVLRRSTR